ncbi:DUF4279 domain-containing protein [Dendronalium sp. ChiSLP03b]|uniref:DUF4279 domain-containing protein n=1 Tax=Dendronalium sp. ChiSLP03b TaxID=3075381 RepID=UPI002AD1DBA7|nr:DUF4279 domain-containing protein [Dendronalium sp. ChiSLP03b]MDZ8203210.1 DUF4279 domain-containing protein [Dendronalium sp. ChiSLP03b]
MENLILVGGLVGETSVCLAIYGEDLNPDEISKYLGCCPTKAYRRGDRRNPNPKYAPYSMQGGIQNSK